MSIRVVIAEDEAIIRLDLKEILEAEGYDVAGATGRGDEAVALVRQHRPDIAILDIQMPGMDGLAAAREISGDGDVAVLILTAFSQRDLVEQARDAGVIAYLVKPFERADLIPAIEVALARFAELKALEAENANLTAVNTDLESSLETRRLLDRAKGKLLDSHGMREADAFSFIRQTAMNRRARMSEIAREVIEGSLAP
jgi:response regulator NasT